MERTTEANNDVYMCGYSSYFRKDFIQNGD